MVALGCLLYLEFHWLASFQALVAIHLDVGIVNKEVITADIRAHEAVALGVVEPLHLSSRHCHCSAFPVAFFLLSEASRAWCKLEARGACVVQLLSSPPGVSSPRWTVLKRCSQAPSQG